jgi:5'-nucleotidase
VPAIAISMTRKGSAHYDTAARIACDLVRRLTDQPFATPVLLNVNVPDLSFDALKGVQVTRLGRRHKAEPVVRTTNPRNETVYWVGDAGAAQDAGEGTDFHATANGFASITPLQIDLTHMAQMGQVRDWLGA